MISDNQVSLMNNGFRYRAVVIDLLHIIGLHKLIEYYYVRVLPGKSMVDLLFTFITVPRAYIEFILNPLTICIGLGQVAATVLQCCEHV